MKDYLTILEAINNNFDNPDLNEPVKPGCYNVCFINGERDDRTQFDLYPGETLIDLINMWDKFAGENGLKEEAVSAVYYAGPDEKMSQEINNAWKNGLVIIRNVDDDEDVLCRGNIYLSPADIKYVIDTVASSIYQKS